MTPVYTKRFNILAAAWRRAGFSSASLKAMEIHLGKEAPGLEPGTQETDKPFGVGGWGILQWTGVRRREFVAAASAAKVPIDDYPFQVAYLIKELKGKGSHWQGISKADIDYILKRETDVDVIGKKLLVHFIRPGSVLTADGPVPWDHPKSVREWNDRKARLNASRNRSKGAVATGKKLATESIKLVQRMLNLLSNAGLKVDGLWGPKTASAAEKFGIRSPESAVEWAQTLHKNLTRLASNKPSASAMV